MDCLRKVKKVGHLGLAIISVLLFLVSLVGLESYARANISNSEVKKAAGKQEIRTAYAPRAVRQAAPAIAARQPEPIRKTYTIEEGDVFFEVLKRNGISAEDALTIIKKTRRVFNTSKIKPGNEIMFVFSPEDQSLVELDYEISDLRKLVVKISGDKITARKVEMDKEEHFIPSANDLVYSSRDRAPRQPELADKSPNAERVSKAKQEDVIPGMRKIDVKIKKGHSLFDILSDIGITRVEIDQFAKSVRGVYNLASLKPGKTLSVWLTQDKPAKIKRLTYEIDDTTYLDVTGGNGSFAARTRELTRDVRLESVQGRIGSSLYGSAVANGVNPEIVMKLADVFAHDINFFSGIHPGDTYAVLYEKYYVKDQFKGYGRVMAAKFVNQGEEHFAIYYDNNRRGIHGYYDEKGRPQRKMFLKAPLNYRRISSFFSKSRMHPIFGVARPHLGVDYAAPSGTPICSLGQGRVVFKGWVKGFGNTIRVRHPEGYVSYYGHLSRFTKSLSVGKSVDQGDTIGFVGSTGYSTGPHLDFRVSHNGRYINPLKMKNVNGPALRGSTLSDFKHISNVRLAMLENRSRNIAMASPSGKKEHEIKDQPKG